MKNNKRNLLYGFIFFCLVISCFSNQYNPDLTVNPRSSIAIPRNSLYLYFAPSLDSSFPDYSDYGADTQPLNVFDVADLDPGIGTTTQLAERIREMVAIDYWEFDVNVLTSNSMPGPTEDRWQIVGIGSDADTTTSGGTIFGEAESVDLGDSDAQDYARVWAGGFLVEYGGTGLALNGADSTLDRWATAIAGTVTHEAGHNYGLSHGNSAPRPGSAEGPQNDHIMATGSTGLSGDDRAGTDRYFSDTSYEILGHNLGLRQKTVYNWDFVNPNDEDAYGMIIKILCVESALTVDWAYQGNRSPWNTPTVTSLGTTEIFQGDSYNIFELEFSVPKSWSGGSDGIVPPAVEFHTGVGFSEDSPIIVTETRLLDDGGADLPLSPRVFGFDTGEVDMESGLFALSVFNFASRSMLIRDLTWFFVPRLIDIDTMMINTEPLDLNGLPINATKSDTIPKDVEINDQVHLEIAKLTDERNVDIHYDPSQSSDTPGDHLDYELNGTALSLFPSTYTYVTATFVDTNATYWSPNQQAFVNGEQEYHVFYQFSGFVPDFNENGVDDLLDIREGTSLDENQNGIPDDAELRPWIPGYSIWILSVVVLIPVAFLLVRYNKPKKD